MWRGITIISLNRRERRNAVDGPTGELLTKAFLEFEEDTGQKVCILYGAHGTFCAGGDLQALSRADVNDPNALFAKRAAPENAVNGRNMGPMGPSRMHIRKPVICAVSGYAVAGGLELSLIGDIRIAEEDTIFGVFCRRFGVPLIDGGTIRLQKVVGFGRAMDMILTGRAVDAQEALSMGLANRVVPKGKSLEAAKEMAELLLTFPYGCMQTDRESAYYAAYEAKSFEDALSHEFENGIKVIGTESVQGASRFSKGEGRHGSKV